MILGDGVPKICVPIAAETIENALKDAKSIAGLPAELAEWRIDWLEDPKSGVGIVPEVKKLLGDKPLLVTFRTAKEGGKKDIGDREYIELYKEYLAAGCIDILDVELFMGDNVVRELIRAAHKAKCKVIMSSHEFTYTPKDEEMIARLCRMQELGADITKLAVMPKTEEDVERLLFITEAMNEMYADRPFVTMSMGDLGMRSRLNGAKTGSAITFGSAAAASAPGQVEVTKLAEILNEAQPGRNNKKKHIFLIGFMGTGKSTIARTLSKYMGIQRIEMDEAIAKQELRPITEIFAAEGEAYFRYLETEYLRNLLNKERKVVSCGGGVPMIRENVELMRSCGTIVLLDARAETVFERVKHSTARPILNGNMNVEYIESLMEKRKDAYEAAADICIDTEGKDVGEISREIMEKLGLRTKK